MPIDAFLFGGRRATVVPLVTEAFDWEHGVFLGATMSVEKTAAADGDRRRAPLRPDGDAAVLRLQHGRLLRPLAEGRRSATGAKLPKIFLVNWFRKDDEGNFVWPGFGENIRVLEWIFRRTEGQGEAVDTPIGLVPAEGEIDIEGTTVSPDDMRLLLEVEPEAVKAQLPQVEEHLARFGDRLPDSLQSQLEALKERLG